MDLLALFRNFFNDLREPVRKRKLNTDDLTFGFPKYRRLSSKLSLMDDVFSKKITRRPSLSRYPNKNQELIVLDDDDDLISKNTRFTSTPTNKFRKETSFLDDDIAFVKEIRRPIRRDSSFRFNFEKPFSLIETLEAAAKCNKKHATRTEKILANCKRNKSNGSPDYCTRLDDKKEFQNLLQSHLSGSSNNASSRYFTASASRLSKYDSINLKGRNMGGLFSKSNNSSACVDLTNENINESSRNGKAKNTKWRQPDKSNGFDAVEIDSDSDDVELVRSPTPEPDFKVEPVNSLKDELRDQYVTDKGWLETLMKQNREKMKTREKELELLAQNNKQLSEINREMRLGLLNRRIDKCLKIKEVILPIEIEDEDELPELTDEQLDQVQHAFRGGPAHEVLVKKYSLNITRKDICTLYGLNWLNDEVINFYMNLIMDRSNEEKYPKAHCFNTFFYPKILKDGPESVRRWTRRIDIFEKDLIIVPIHLGVHWCMAIIDFRDQSIRYYDSMGNSNEKCLNALCNYLEAEHLDKKKVPYDTSDFIQECPKDIPQQMNGSDCGVFSCTVAEFYSRNAKLTYSQEQMPYFRKKMVYEILRGELMIK